MGCPVPKVVKTGAGSALMKDLPRAAEIISASVKAAAAYRIPVTVKFRKGWDAEHVNAAEFAHMCADCGASAVTVHARTRDQMYHGKADWEVLRQVADVLRGTGVTVIGNGDVKDGPSARKMLEETGVDGVAVGRAAQGDPWIFARIRAFMRGEEPPAAPTPTERADIVLRHLRGLTGRLGEKIAVKEMRTQLAFYFKGQKNAADFRSAAMHAETFAEVEDTMYRWVEAATSGSSRKDL
jgi:nifR3 family TIM-barrel protein